MVIGIIVNYSTFHSQRRFFVLRSRLLPRSLSWYSRKRIKSPLDYCSGDPVALPLLLTFIPATSRHG